MVKNDLLNQRSLHKSDYILLGQQRNYGALAPSTEEQTDGVSRIEMPDRSLGQWHL